MTRLPEAQEKYRKLHKPPLEPSLSGDQMPPHQQHQHQQSLANDSDLCPGSHQLQPTNTDSSVPGSPRSPGSRSRTANNQKQSSRLGVIESQRTAGSQSSERPVFDYTHVGPTSTSSITFERSPAPADAWGSSAVIPPPWPSPASARGSQFLSPPSQGYALLGDSAREKVSTGSEVFDRLRAKSLRIRHRPNLRTIREKSQSIDTLHK